MKTIDLHYAVATVQQIVRDFQVTHGPGVKYRYIDPVGAMPGNGCRYFQPDGQAGCLVGQFIAHEGIKAFITPDNNNRPFFTTVQEDLAKQGLEFTDDAAKFLRRVQELQDADVSWQRAVAVTLSEIDYQPTLLEIDYQPPVDGDIGEPIREIEMEPFPATEPVKEPAPVVVPAEPEKVPV